MDSVGFLNISVNYFLTSERMKEYETKATFFY